MTTSLIRTRYGAADDVVRVVALHDRCSADTLSRRFHAPLVRVPERVSRQLVAPDLGWSLLAEEGDRLVGVATVGSLSAHDLEVGILVEDAHQRRGVGSRLLNEVAVDATARGYVSLLCLTQPDNDAVPAAVRRAGLRHTATVSDGLMTVVVHLVGSDALLPLPA